MGEKHYKQVFIILVLKEKKHFVLNPYLKLSIMFLDKKPWLTPMHRLVPHNTPERADLGWNNN